MKADWQTKSLGELVELCYGKALKAEDRPSDGQFPVYGSNGIVGTSHAALVEYPTIVIGRKGAVGEAHLAERGCWPIDTTFFTKHRKESQCDLRYLLLWLRSINLRQLAITATVPGINRDTLSAQLVPLPPLSEQERIVRILDEAEELQKLRAQADHRTADLIPALFHDMFSKLDEIKGCPVCPLSEVAEVASGVAKGRRFNGQTPVTVPYIRVANVQAGYLDLSEIKTIEALPSEVKDLTLKKGDLLLTEGGDFDKLGRGAMWEHEIPNCIHQNHIFRVRVEQSKLLPIYFEKFLQTPTARTYFLGCAKRTTNLASINMTQLRGLPVPIPPLSLQREFAVHVAEIRTMESHQATSRRRLEDLFQSLLHRALAGQL